MEKPGLASLNPQASAKYLLMVTISCMGINECQFYILSASLNAHFSFMSLNLNLKSFMLSGLFLLSARLSAHSAYLSDVAESIDVWHRGRFVGGHNYFPRLLVELHTELFQAQGFGFRGSA